MGEVIEVSDANFEDKVIKASKEKIVVVDFWASWCSPCRMLAPIMERIAVKYKEKLIVAKINVEENQIQPQKYYVSGIPAVKMFKNGKVVDEFIGYIPQEMVGEWVEKNIKSRK